MIAVIDYMPGSAEAVAEALKEVTTDFVVTKREIDICKSEKIILPGTGIPSMAMRQLMLVNISNLFRIIKKPLLGICLGAEILCDKSDEGNIPCLGIFPMTVTRLKSEDQPVHHLGMSPVKITREGKLFQGIADNEEFYFDHSYYIPDSEFTTSKSSFGIEFAASIEKSNFYAVQFNPEKSGAAGLKLLKNFVELC